MDGKVFSEETVDLIVKAADDAIPLPWYAEPVDGPGIRVIVNFVNKKADQVVPDEVDPFINAAIQNAFAGNIEEAEQNAATAVNMVIDIPLLDEEAEQRAILSGIQFIVNLVAAWVAKKKQAATA